MAVPSIMRGWDGLDNYGWFARDSVAPLMADSHVNLVAVTKPRPYRPGTDRFMLIKVGAVGGSGIPIDKRSIGVHREPPVMSATSSSVS